VRRWAPLRAPQRESITHHVHSATVTACFNEVVQQAVFNRVVIARDKGALVRPTKELRCADRIAAVSERNLCERPHERDKTVNVEAGISRIARTHHGNITKHVAVRVADSRVCHFVTSACQRDAVACVEEDRAIARVPEDKI
jgi:hypothetical protein